MSEKFSKLRSEEVLSAVSFEAAPLVILFPSPSFFYNCRNPFMCFSEAKRTSLKEKHPEALTKEIAKMLGEMWRNMRDQDKEPYLQMAQRDKERFEEEMSAFMKGDYVVPSTSMPVDMVEAEE